MDGGMSYVREIESLDKEIKRLNAVLKKLRDQRTERKKELYEYMTSHNKEKVGSIGIKKIAPRKPITRKPMKEKKADAMALFERVGIHNPTEFWAEFQLTQTPSTVE